MSRVHDKLEDLSNAPAADPIPPLRLVPFNAQAKTSRVHRFRAAYVIAIVGILANVALYATRHLMTRAKILEHVRSEAVSERVNQFIAHAQWPEAVQALQSIVKTETQNVTALVELAAVQKKSGHLDLALQALQEALAIDPNEPVALNNIGQIYASQNHWPEAIASYSKALENRKDLLEANMNLAAAYEMTGEWALSIAQYEIFLKSDKSHFDLHSEIEKRLRLLHAFQTYAESHKEKD